MGQKLHVFVSSSIQEFPGHRDLIVKELNCNPIIDCYSFEHSPAHVVMNWTDFPATYLAKLQDSDLMVLVIGKELRRPVEAELQVALENQIPILLFLEERYRDFPHVAEVRGRVHGKYQTFVRATELASKVVEAVHDHIVDTYRRVWQATR